MSSSISHKEWCFRCGLAISVMSFGTKIPFINILPCHFQGFVFQDREKLKELAPEKYCIK